MIKKGGKKGDRIIVNVTDVDIWEKKGYKIEGSVIGLGTASASAVTPSPAGKAEDVASFLADKTVAGLRKIAKDSGIVLEDGMQKDKIVKVLTAQADKVKVG